MPASIKVSNEIITQIEIYLNKNYLSIKELANKLSLNEKFLYYIRRNKTTSAKTLKKLKDHGIIE